MMSRSDAGNAKAEVARRREERTASIFDWGQWLMEEKYRDIVDLAETANLHSEFLYDDFALE